MTTKTTQPAATPADGHPRPGGQGCAQLGGGGGPRREVPAPRAPAGPSCRSRPAARARGAARPARRPPQSRLQRRTCSAPPAARPARRWEPREWAWGRSPAPPRALAGASILTFRAPRRRSPRSPAVSPAPGLRSLRRGAARPGHPPPPPLGAAGSAAAQPGAHSSRPPDPAPRALPHPRAVTEENA